MTGPTGAPISTRRQVVASPGTGGASQVRAGREGEAGSNPVQAKKTMLLELIAAPHAEVGLGVWVPLPPGLGDPPDTCRGALLDAVAFHVHAPEPPLGFGVPLLAPHSEHVRSVDVGALSGVLTLGLTWVGVGALCGPLVPGGGTRARHTHSGNMQQHNTVRTHWTSPTHAPEPQRSAWAVPRDDTATSGGGGNTPLGGLLVVGLPDAVPGVAHVAQVELRVHEAFWGETKTWG